MSHSTIPAQAIPIAAAPSSAAVQPVSAEDVAALASRMRVEARLPRVIVVGTVLGLVCGVVTMWPIVWADEFLVRSMSSFHRSKIVGWVSVGAPLALVGLLLLLAFYSLRLHVQSGPSTPAALEDNLRKIRRILAAGMFAALGAMAAVLSMPRDAADMGVLGLYAVCCVACGVMVGDVRKGLGEFESREERQRRRMVRGFAVELRGGGNGSPPLATVTAPLSVLPVPALRVDPPPAEAGGPAGAAIGSAASMGRLPPPLPVNAVPQIPRPAAPVAAIPVAGADLAGTQGERDLRTMLHLLAALGIGIYVLRSPLLLRALGDWSNLFNAATRANPWGASGSFDARFFTHVAQLIIATCGVAWMAWGVVVLSFGARLRLITLVLAWVTLAAVVAYAASIVAGDDARGVRVRVDTREQIIGALNPHLAELVHAAAMLVLLTRPRVKDLFTAGSEAGEGA